MDNGDIVAGELVRLAAKRHLDDLVRGDERGLRFDVDNANDAIAFFETFLRFYDGERAGELFKLEPFQCFIIGSLFGWKGADGYRRFRTAYVEIGKGNGKSPMAGGIGLLGLVADGEAGAEIYSAAVVKDQARILFRDAEKMVEASPELSEIVHSNVGNLSVASTASFFRPISSEKRGLDGKRVHMALIDELHEHPSSIVVDKMRAGTKGRRQALIFEITNSGYDRHSVCYQHHDYSRKVLEGVLPNDSWFAYVCGLDEGDDYRDRRVWIKANPNVGVSIGWKYLEEQVNEAAGIPSKENIVKRLNFCIWTEQAERWLPMDVWDAKENAEPFDPDELLGEDCFAGLDLASTRDLNSLCLLFPPNFRRKVWRALWYFWIPRDNIRQRVERDRVPYDQWVKEGLVRTTPGTATDYDQLRRDISGVYFEGGADNTAKRCYDPTCIAKKYNILQLGFDKHNAIQLATQLGEDGLTMVEISQGILSLNAPTKELERLLLRKEFQHGGNKVARWNMSNVAVAADAAGNIKPDKERSTEKIDGISACVDALARAIVRPQPTYTPTRVLFV